jgi:hypothetical protein
MEDNMIRRTSMLAMTIGLMALSSGAAFSADEHEQQALMKSIGDAKITLQQGLTAAEAQGQPISGKFEVEDGKLQLSVYTAKDGKFFEVVIDFVGGKVTKTEPITEGEDLTAAKAQSAAMMKAKTSLKAAVDKALGQSAGARAIEVVPELKDGHTVANVTLLKEKEFKTMPQSLE